MKEDMLKKAAMDMGWSSLTSIPMANEENLLLLKELEELTQTKQTLEDDHKDLEDRTNKLEEHIKSSQLCIEQNLSLLEAYQNDSMRETHLLKLAEREESKLKEDLTKLDEDYETHELFVQATNTELEKVKNDIKTMTDRLKWAKNAMSIWQEAMDEGKSGFQLIEKYLKDDKALAKQKEKEMQLLQAELNRSRKEMVEKLETKTRLEEAIESLGKAFRNAHAERRQMIEIWKSAVKQMVNREQAIEAGDNELAKLKAKHKIISTKLQIKNEDYDECMEERRKLEIEIEEVNKKLCRSKEESSLLKNTVENKEKQLYIYQIDLQNVTNEVERIRAECRQQQILGSKKTEELDKSMDQVRKADKRLKKFGDKTVSAQQRLEMLEEMMDTEEKAIKQLNLETQQLNDLRFRVEAQMTDLKSEVKKVEMKNEGIKGAIQAVVKNVRDAKRDLKRETEILYNLSFKCVELERKISQQVGGSVDPIMEQRRMERLAELEELNGKVVKKLQATEIINKKLDENMRQLTLVYDRDSKELIKINSKIKDVQSYYEGGVKRLKEEKHLNQVLIVELSLLKMKAHNFEEEIKKTENGRSNINQQRSRMEVSIKERLKKLDTQMGILNTKRKTLFDERSTLIADITDRKKHIETMKIRFELTSKLLGTNEDGTLVTSTQLQIEAAQERHLLIDEGNALNKKVINAERDIKAMENTLVLMNASNCNFRDSLQGSSSDKDELKQELLDLEKMNCDYSIDMKRIQDDTTRKEQELKNVQIEIENLEIDFKNLIEEKANLEENSKKSHKECAQQKEKMLRAERELQNAIKALKEFDQATEKFELIEREIYMQSLEERCALILNSLVDVIHSDQEASNIILKCFEDKNIQMPHHMQSTRSFEMFRRSTTSLTSSSNTSRDMPYSSSRSSGSDTERSSQLAKVNVHSIEFSL